MENKEYKYKNWCVNILFSQPMQAQEIFNALQYLANEPHVSQIQHVGFCQPPLTCCHVSFDAELLKKDVFGIVGTRLRSMKIGLSFSVESTTFFKNFAALTGQAAQIINHQL